MKAIIYTIIAGLLAVSFAVAWQFHEIDQSRASGAQQVCSRIASLDNTLIDLVRQGEKSTARFQYYREHPDELRIVIQQDERAIRALTPPHFCS